MFKMIFLPLNIGDYSTTASEMNAELCGCYVNLLIKAWVSGGYLPDDDDRLAGMARVSKAKWLKKVKPIMREIFSSDGERWWHEEMLAELQKVQAKMKKNRELGALGGEATALKNNELRAANAAAILKLDPELEQKEEQKEEYINNNLQPIDTPLEVVESTRARAPKPEPEQIPDPVYVPKSPRWTLSEEGRAGLEQRRKIREEREAAELRAELAAEAPRQKRSAVVPSAYNGNEYKPAGVPAPTGNGSSMMCGSSDDVPF